MSDPNVTVGQVNDSTAIAIENQQTATQDGEKLFAGKYKSVEELEKGYLEAQKLISSRQQTQTDPAQQTNANEQQTNQQTQRTIEPPPQVQRLDWEGLNKEWADNGELSAATYEKLEKDHGFPRDVVDAYIEGRKAQTSAFDNAVFGAAGGEEQYGLMIEWAKTNLTKDEIAGFNAAVSGNNVQQAKLAAEGLAARYRAKNGSAPGLLNGSMSSGGGVQPFKSEAEVVRAMNDPKYRNDKAYRNEVMERLKVSEVFG